MKKRPIIAILYDYDSTLCQGNMQDYGFFPALGINPNDFWNQTNKFSNDAGCESTLAFLYLMLTECQKHNVKCTKKWLNSLGKNIVFFPGVIDWFERINQYGKKKGVEIEHYIVSSGNKEIIEGSKIAKEFKEIYACEFYYDKKNSTPTWPKLVINYTQKTQFFYRVSKGVTDIRDEVSINKKKAKPRIKHSNIIYIGDGLTDVPCMTIVKKSGGQSIAVYSKKKRETVIDLMKENRVNYACEANYRPNSELDKIVKLIIDNIAIVEKLERRQHKENTKL